MERKIPLYTENFSSTEWNLSSSKFQFHVKEIIPLHGAEKTLQAYRTENYCE